MNACGRIRPGLVPRAVFVLVSVSAVAVPALADVKMGTIPNITLPHRDFCDSPTQNINLGSMSITLDNAANGGGMSAAFTVNPAVNIAANAALWRCVELHYVQLITYDDDPASVAGTPAGAPGLRFPVVDTPPGGWDYIYNDSNGVPGIQAGERVPGNVTSPDLVDDANDLLPWYHTTQEEAGAVGSGNEAPGWELGEINRGVTYGIKDGPSFPGPSTQHTDFSTFLVAVSNHLCLEQDECLRPNQMLVLAGFDWVWSRDNEVLRLFTPSQLANAADTINQALANTGFPGWEAVGDGVVCCPEPPTSVLAAMAIAGMVVNLRRRKAVWLQTCMKRR